jgi:hypothetical protein
MRIAGVEGKFWVVNTITNGKKRRTGCFPTQTREVFRMPAAFWEDMPVFTKKREPL